MLFCCSKNAPATKTTALGMIGATLAIVAAVIALTDEPGSSTIPFALLGVGMALALSSSSGSSCCLTRLFKRTTPRSEAQPAASHPYAPSRDARPDRAG